MVDLKLLSERLFSKVGLILIGQKNVFHTSSRGCRGILGLESRVGRGHVNRVAREAPKRSHRNQGSGREKLTWEWYRRCNDLSMVRAHDIQTRVKGT